MIDAGKCWKCKCQIWLPDELYQAAKKSASISIHCGYGHAGVFREGPSDEEKMCQERDRMAQRVAEWQDEAKQQHERAERRTSAARGQITKIKNRIGRGVCPCCNRSFENLARHMGSEHPTFTAEAAE